VVMSLPAAFLVARLVPFDRLPSLCGFYRLSGYPCPFCGMTRAAAALAQFNLGQAVRWNVMLLPVAGFLGVWWLDSIYEMITGRRTRLGSWVCRRTGVFLWLALGAFLLFGVLRIVFLSL
jgi:hypothetical protein